MSKLRDEIKKLKMTMEEFGKSHEVTRQTMYKYIDLYEEGEYDKIPNDVCKKFNEIMGEDQNTKNKETFNREIEKIHDEINKITYKNEMIKEMIKEYETKLTVVVDKNGKAKEFDHGEEIKHLKMMKDENDKEIEKLKGKAKGILIEHSGKLDESIDLQIGKLLAEGMYGGPSWSRSKQDLKTLCVADSGDYMVITDDPLGMRTELKLYAVIAGVREFIARYDFKENERFVKFSLIPKLSYYYEVVQYGTDCVFTSGVLKLKNFDDKFRTIETGC